MLQKSLARYVIDNGGVTHVPQCEAFVVNGNNDRKYCVTLNPEKCQCPSSSTCYHIIAVKMFVGLPVNDVPREVNLRTLSKRSLKRSDKKSGRKRPRANDLDPIVIPAPDSILSSNTENTKAESSGIENDTCFIAEPDMLPTMKPKSKKKLRFNAKASDIKLPAKKRKIHFETETLEKAEPWVGTLTMDHKAKILNRQYICSDIIQAAQNILKRQFPDVDGMQPTTCAPVWSESENKWNNQFPFTSVSLPAAQVHHTGRDHWVTSVNNNGQIHVLDSLSSGKLTPSLEIQLAHLYGNGNASKLFSMKIPSIQQQANGHDCGVYAIANLTEFCYGRINGRDEVKYSEQYMRDHLVHCLEKQHFVKFPRMVTQAKINKRKPKVSIPCDCPCKRPNCMEGMVGCDGLSGTCPSWRHRSCANISTSNADADWFCTPYRK